MNRIDLSKPDSTFKDFFSVDRIGHETTIHRIDFATWEQKAAINLENSIRRILIDLSEIG